MRPTTAVGVAAFVLLTASCKPSGATNAAAAHAGRVGRVAEASREQRQQRNPVDHGDLTRSIAGYLRHREGRAALWVEDLRTGDSFGYQQHSRFITASVAKVNILAGLLLQHQAEHRGLTGDERDLAEQMIRNSDNDAADALYSEAGQGEGIGKIDAGLGMVHTEPYPTVWGATETCPYDQVRLLHLLTDPQSPLTPANRGYVLGLMRTVSDDQRWGISAAARDGESVALKNGWTPLHYQGSGWAVHSIGRITGPGHDFLIAVFSAEQPDMGTGIQTVEHLATMAVTALRH
jgi:hypothetical protein